MTSQAKVDAGKRLLQTMRRRYEAVQCERDELLGVLHAVVTLAEIIERYENPDTCPRCDEVRDDGVRACDVHEDGTGHLGGDA